MTSLSINFLLLSEGCKVSQVEVNRLYLLISFKQEAYKTIGVDGFGGSNVDFEDNKDVVKHKDHHPFGCILSP